MKKYEIMYILDEKIEDLKSVEDKFNNILTTNGGKILEKSSWGLKDFAYPINKKNKGHYYVLIADTDSSNIDEFKRLSQIDKNVIRTFVLNTEKEKHYIQSTQLSKTEVKNEKFERKTIGKKYEKRVINNVDKDKNASLPNSDSNEAPTVSLQKSDNAENK